MSALTGFFRSFHRLGLAALICQGVAGSAGGQTAGYLHVTAIDGEGAFNDVKHRLSHPPSVRIVDESNNPAAGAQVAFTLPSVGPGGTFEGGVQTALAMADQQGIAKCPSFIPNQVEGRFTIKANASYQGKTGITTISESNTLAGGISVGEKKSHGKLILLVLAAGGGAAGGILAASHHGSAPAAPTPTGLSVVSITVGAPR